MTDTHFCSQPSLIGALIAEAPLLPRTMFLGNAAHGCEDKILTLINELFTGQFSPVKSGYFHFFVEKAAVQRFILLARRSLRSESELRSRSY